MKFTIKHEAHNRMRIHLHQKKMTCEQADILLYFLTQNPQISDAKVYERTADAAFSYTGDRRILLVSLQSFQYAKTDVPKDVIERSGRQLNAAYQEKLIGMVCSHYARRLFLPAPLRTCYTIYRAIPYLSKGLHTLWQRKIEVPVLDAAAIGISLLRNDTNTAGSVMFLLGIGELLEEWTHKKSVGDLARTMSLNISKVWKKVDDTEVLVQTSSIQTGDEVVVRMGNVIPFDGEVTDGDAMVNQSSLTGESIPVQRTVHNTVFAGTVVEEGELTIRVSEVGGSSRFEKIITMIEDSEKLKSASESRAEHLADRLVPYTLGGTVLTYLLTRNTTKALSVLMVDFSCALKLAMPISVLSAIREAHTYQITVKGGKFLEAVHAADTIVFDKTGTLTKAKPTVVDVVSFNEMSGNELLRIAACMEEHFPHSMAKAVIQAAQERHLEHEEMHSKVEYIVAHGISTTLNSADDTLNGKRAIIGSYHFVFEDEHCVIPEELHARFEALPEEYSHLYLAIENRLAAVICIEDPLRKEAKAVVKELRKAGIKHIVMMTGDSERTARAIAKRVGVDEYYSEVLPEDKASYVARAKALGRKVIMIGDGINDSPALSAADVGIAICDGAEIAKEIADITIGADDLGQLVTLKHISDGLMRRIHSNYRVIVSFNTGLIVLGVAGVIQPTTSALLHNTSTLAIGLKSMSNVLG